MCTARFIGGWVAGLLAASVAVTLFVQWLRFALDAGGTVPTPLFLWMAFGANLLVWTAIGALRLMEDVARSVWARPRTSRGGPGGHAPSAGVEGDEERVLVHAGAAGPPTPSGAVPGPRVAPAVTETGDPDPVALAVVIPAHNEAPVIDGAIGSALRLFDRWDIYVVSDSSRDSTADIAAETGVNVLELLSNRGKAGSIEAVVQEFRLIESYDAVVILDADTELDARYVEGVRRQLRDPEVAAVAGFVVAQWKPNERSVVGRLISAYRDRLYWMLQYLLRFGQTWRRTSVTFIVPGFASAYRTSALRRIDVNPGGLVIEDFNMTFEVQRKRLGRISMDPGTKAYCQDPFTLSDYVRQVRRWTLGFWQTVRLHGIWPSLFWLALLSYILEIVFVAFALLAMAGLAAFTALPLATDGAVLTIGGYAASYDAVTSVLPLTAIAVGMFVPDYVLTCVMATIRRRPGYLVYGLFFLPIRLIDAFLTLRTIPLAWSTLSDGRWRSPGRESGPL